MKKHTLLQTVLAAVVSISLPQTSFASDDKHEAGEKLFKANCAVCHGANVGGMDMSKRIAPPIAAVRMHYIGSHPDQASFVQAISSWVEKQDPNKSLMRGAIQKFKIMPPLSMPKEDVEKIAAYIYAGDIEKPEGFEKHVEEMHGKMGMGMMHGQGKGMQQMMQGGGMHGMKHAMQGEHMAGKMQHGNKRRGMRAMMMKQLNLSPQQQQKMQVLIQEKESRIRPVKQEIRQITQAIHQLDTTSPDYKAKIFSLAGDKAKRVQRMVIEKGEMRMKIESILTPEQRAKFKQLRQKRRAMKQNH